MKKLTVIAIMLMAICMTVNADANDDYWAARRQRIMEQKRAERNANSATNKVRVVMISPDEWEKVKKQVDTHRHYEFEKQKVHLWVTNGVDEVFAPRFVVPRGIPGRRGDDKKKEKPVPPHPQPYGGQSL